MPAPDMRSTCGRFTVRAASTATPAPAINASPGRIGTTYRLGWYEFETTPSRPNATHISPTIATRVGPAIARGSSARRRRLACGPAGFGSRCVPAPSPPHEIGQDDHQPGDRSDDQRSGKARGAVVRPEVQEDVRHPVRDASRKCASRQQGERPTRHIGSRLCDEDEPGHTGHARRSPPRSRGTVAVSAPGCLGRRSPAGSRLRSAAHSP